MTGLDAAFLYAETPSQHMHVALVGMFDTASMKGGYRFETIKSLIEARLPRIPMFTRRLVQVPFRLHHPVLVEDPDFDMDFHVRRMAAPAPGSLRELCEMAGDFVSRPLDRKRPMWQMWVVEGLQEGRIGILAKVHHCLIDGVTGAEMMVHLFDLEPEPAAEPDPGTRAVEKIPTDMELVAYAARSMARRPARLASTLVGTARSIGGLARRRREGGPGMAAPFSAPRTPWNGAITGHRAVAVGTLA
ncbi:MAG: wax ester/triacylglycerol synthase domain-containing protein, partial [Acidimicrobiales bacterium]